MVNAQDYYDLQRKYYYLCVRPFELKMTDSLQKEIDKICNQLDSLSYIEFCKENQKLKNNYDTLLNRLINSNNKQSDYFLKNLFGFPTPREFYKYYYYIKKNSELIIPYCSDYKKDWFQRRVLISLDIPNNLKDSLLILKDKLSLSERAKLGDESAEDSLINIFKYQVENTQSRSELRDLETTIDDLLFVNSKKCLNTIIDYLGSNILMETKKNEYIISALYVIIYEYSMFYPDCYELSTVNLWYHSNSWYDRNWYNKEQRSKMLHYEKRYIEQIQNYCLKQFGRILNIDLPFLYFEDYGCLIGIDEFDKIILPIRQFNN